MRSLNFGAALLASAFVAGISITPAFAYGDLPPHLGGGATHVPEIDATSGIAALAAVGAALAFVRERRRGKH